MITIDERLIRLQSRAADKQEAIRQAGQLLVDTGYIDAGYIASMIGREEVANTYLGNGISIPHGLPKDRDLIKQTGIAVVQVPAGVTWNPGETARLVVGIAAKSDEHIEMLRRLTRVLGDQEQVARLTQTIDPRDIIEALTGERPAAPPRSADVADYANFLDAVILNRSSTRPDCMPVLPPPLSIWPSAFRPTSKCVTVMPSPMGKASSPCCNWASNMARLFAFRPRALMLPLPLMPSSLPLP